MSVSHRSGVFVIERIGLRLKCNLHHEWTIDSSFALHARIDRGGAGPMLILAHPAAASVSAIEVRFVSPDGTVTGWSPLVGTPDGTAVTYRMMFATPSGNSLAVRIARNGQITELEPLTL